MRISYAEPSVARFAIGPDSVKGVCKHLVQPCFKRAQMRWKGHGFDDLIEPRITRVTGTFATFWQRARAPRSAA